MESGVVFFGWQEFLELDFLGVQRCWWFFSALEGFHCNQRSFGVFTKVVKGCKCWKGYFGGLSAKAGPNKKRKGRWSEKSKGEKAKNGGRVNLAAGKIQFRNFLFSTVMPFAKLFDCLLLSMLELGNRQWKNCYRKSPSWLGRKKLGPL